MVSSLSLEMRQCFTELWTRKSVKWYGSLLFSRKYTKKIMNIGLDAVTTTSKKVVHKAGKFLGN